MYHFQVFWLAFPNLEIMIYGLKRQIQIPDVVSQWWRKRLIAHIVRGLDFGFCKLDVTGTFAQHFSE